MENTDKTIIVKIVGMKMDDKSERLALSNFFGKLLEAAEGEKRIVIEINK